MPKNKLRVYAHYPFTGAGAGHDSIGEAMLRFTRVVQAVKSDAKTLKDDPEQTLTILLAPEWNFKKRQGFFSYADAMGAIAALQDLSRGSPILIVAGSILWAMPGRNQVGQTRDFSFKKFKFVEKDIYQDHAVVYNTLPILQNGEVVHLVHKMFEGKDTTPRNARAGTEMFAFDPQSFQADQFWQQWKDRIRSVSPIGSPVPDLSANIFTRHELRFGVEICADHGLNRRLKNLGQTVDVQILISCGAYLAKTALAVRPGGVALSCDGAVAEERLESVRAFIMPAVLGAFPWLEGRKVLTGVERTVRLDWITLA